MLENPIPAAHDAEEAGELAARLFREKANLATVSNRFSFFRFLEMASLVFFILGILTGIVLFVEVGLLAASISISPVSSCIVCWVVMYNMRKKYGLVRDDILADAEDARYRAEAVHRIIVQRDPNNV